MPAWGALGMQVAGEAASGAMGILAQRIGKNYDRKQWIKYYRAKNKRLGYGDDEKNWEQELCLS